jgi:hypothetical protein
MAFAGLAAASVAAPIGISDVGLGLIDPESPSGELLRNWSLPLTCFAGSVLGGLLAVIMADKDRPKTFRSEGIIWLGSSLTALLFGPALCQAIPYFGFKLTADNVLAVSGLMGFLAWPAMAIVQTYGPDRIKDWLGTPFKKKGPQEPEEASE